MKWLEDQPNKDGTIDLDRYSHYELECSGRRFYANGGILGLGPDDGPDDFPSEGYDGTARPDAEEFQSEAFTPEEQREIALEMIARWKRWGRL